MKRVLGAAGLTFTLLTTLWVASAWEPDRSVDSLKARWAAPPSTFLPLDGMNVHLRDEGSRDDAVPIVLLHGTSASLHTWDGWTAALSKNRRVIRFDLPGFGLTGPSPTSDYTIAAYSRFVVAMLDALSVKRCVLAGNSLGGEIAWATAVATPDRVSALILVDAAGHRLRSASVPIGFRAARVPVLNKLFLKLLPRRIVTSSVRNVYGDPSKVTDELVDRYFELTLREGNRAALPLRFEQAVSGANEENVKKVTAPTLILWGGLDGLIPLEHAALFAKEIAGSTLVTFPSLGHVPQEEDAAVSVAEVQRFLAAQRPPGLP